MLPAFTPTWWAAVSCALAAAALSPALAQTPLGDSITYQGLLKQSGAPVNGNADFQFRLFDGAGGAALQVGSTLALNNIPLTDGVFTVSLDFGDDLYDGSERWLEIAVRVPAGGGGGLTTLTPRQLLRGAPYALFALAGNEGPQGPVGPQGIQGPPGPAGDSHWPLNGPNTYFNTGNVGIGTDTPSTPLYVVGEIHSDQFISVGTLGSALGSDQGGSMELGPTNDIGGQQPYIDLHYGGGVAQDFSARIQAAAGDHLRISTSTGPDALNLRGGNLGIGTQAPDSRLQSVQDGDWDATEFNPHALLLSSGGATGMELYLGGDEDSSVCYLQSVRRATGVRSLALNARGGNVGVGMDNPAAAFHVGGTGRFDGALTANAGVTLATTTRYASISGNGFQPWSASMSYAKFEAYVRGASAGDLITLFAPVHVPHQAIVTSMEATVHDDDAVQNILVELERVSNTGALAVMGSVSSAGSSASAQNIADLSIGFATVFNDTNSYFVRATWTVPATALDVRLYRVRVAYTITAPLP